VNVASPPADDVTIAKKALREATKARRAALPAAERAAAATALAGAGADLVQRLAPPPAIVSAFLAIGDEIDPSPLIAALVAHGYTTALPVMVGKGRPLAFRAWSPGDPLVERMWGIREPAAACRAVIPDVLLVPLLAFDRNGQRLGYGGGFYDRTLAALRATRAVHAVGIAFACQQVDAVPHLDYDQRLDWVLTPEGPLSASP
jgi:5-formyltetrahydrofolate cyclo-ligase